MEINHKMITMVLLLPLAIYAGMAVFLMLAAVFRRKQGTGVNGTPVVSVVIAARNESLTLPALLECLQHQQYPDGYLEIIVADDHSEDDTALQAGAFRGVTVVRLATIAGKPAGKKAALAEGLKVARGDVFLFTDADCRPRTGWVKEMAAPFSDAGVQLVAGPVAVRGKGWCAAMQELEFMGIMGSTALSMAAGFPLMVNGASLAIRAKAYAGISSATAGSGYASGDDMFAMMAIRKAFGKKALRFAAVREALVLTPPADSLKAFFGQRVRWAGKTGGYPLGYIRVAAVLVFLVCLAMTAALGMAVGNLEYAGVFVAMFVMKSMTDALVMAPVARLQGGWRLFWQIPVLQLLYPFYVLAVAIAGPFMRPLWKGREIK